MKLIAGLGNPGKEYEKTRHNAGFMGVEYLADFFRFVDFKKADKFKAEISEGVIGGEKVFLVKPQTFMNLSGCSVRGLMDFYKISLPDFIVIFDDADIDSGALRVRRSGSAGGHNGVKSIIQELGTGDFLRVRLGISPMADFKGALEDYVLGKFSEEEMDLLKKNLERLPKIVEGVMKGEAEEVMNENN